MTYLPDAQLPKSMVRQRSLQNGNSGFARATFLWQIGHFINRNQGGGNWRPRKLDKRRACRRHYRARVTSEERSDEIVVVGFGNAQFANLAGMRLRAFKVVDQ